METTSLRDTPIRFLLLALLASGVSLYLALAPSWDPWRGSGTTLADSWGGLVSFVSAALWAAAPLVALSWPQRAAGLAFLPFLTFTLVFSHTHEWPFAAYTALVGTAMVAVRRSYRQGMLLGVTALVPPATYLFGWTTVLLPYSTRLQADSAERGVGYQFTTLALYALATLLLVGAGAWIAHATPSRSATSTKPRLPLEIDGLTRRETEIFWLMVQGRTNREIAEELVVGTETVKSHVAEVLRKLRLRDRNAAVIYAYERGIVEPKLPPEDPS